MNEDYKNRGMDLKRFTLYFQKKIWIILLLILVGGMIGAISYRMIRTMKMPVEYESVSKLYITFNQDENGDVYQYYNGYTWNELLDTDPILIAIMNHLTGYEEEEVKDAASAEILSDIRLLTITVKGDSEKMVREIQAAVEEGLADYADQSEELRKIVTIRSDMPKRIYWSDDTTKALIAGAILFGLVSFFVFGFMYVLDDGVYVQAERRYPYKALGIITRNQKGLQPFVRELKADLLYVMGDSRDMLLLDMDGTFLDFEAAEKSAFRTAMIRHGYPAGEREYAVYGKINHGLWEAFERGEIDKPTLLSTRFGRLFEALGIKGDGAAFEREYQALLGEGAQLVEGAEEVLSYLAERYALYVVTNGVERTQRNRLRLSGIDRFMTGIFISGTIGWQKPQKEFFDCCFERIPGLDRSRTLIIGDSLTSDIQGGFNAGIETCWFNPKGKKKPEGFGRTWEKEAHRDFEIGSLYELKELL